MSPAADTVRDPADLAYVTGRCVSFGHQLDAVLALSPRSVLEVGVGAGVVSTALRHLGIPLCTLDVDPAREPDVLASVESIPADEGTWDVGLCCQVLEHLPFDRLGPALRELHRVTARGLVLSLPDVTRDLELTVRAPRLGLRRLAGRSPLPRRRAFTRDRLDSMGHHWEIGFRGTPLTAVQSVIAVAGWHVERTWRVAEIPWHRFFVLRHADRREP